MATDTAHAATPGVDIALGALGALFGLDTVFWAAGWCSAVLSGHRSPHGHLLAGLVALAHGGDPSVAWGAPVGPPVLYWGLATVFVLTLAALAWAGWRAWSGLGRKAAEDPARIAGLADRRQVRAAAGEAALVARATTLRPSVSRARPGDVGYRLGDSCGVGCWASVEDSMVALGPPRSGKGLHLVIPMILDAPGAVVTTSTRPDNLTVTLRARSSEGRPVAVFDPQGLAPGVPSATRWSPIRGCEHPQTAMIRARALCADAGGGTDNASFWTQQTLSAVRCLLHAAALDNRSAADLYRWSLTPAAAHEAVEVLADHPGAAQAWDRALDAIICADRRQRDSTWAMVANTFAALADPQVLDAVSPGPGERFDPVNFLAARGTLYLLGTASGAAATAGLVTAFVEDLVEVARRVAAASSGARMDPPLALILDEAANYAIPSLPSLMSEGGGTGITTVAVLQSLAQARDRWGHEASQAIWDSAIVKIILGGGGNADDLIDLSRLIGDRKELERSESWGGQAGRRSVSTSMRERPILAPDALRRLSFGHGLVLLRAAPPIMLRLRPWTERTDGPELVRERSAVEETIRAAARLRTATGRR